MPSLTSSPLPSRVSTRVAISARVPAKLPTDPAKRRRTRPVPLNGHALVPVSPTGDIQILFPEPGRVEIQSRALFSDAYSLFSRQFIERAFLAPEVESVGVDGNRKRAEITIRASDTPFRELLR